MAWPADGFGPAPNLAQAAKPAVNKYDKDAQSLLDHADCASNYVDGDAAVPEQYSMR
jgi:hypothetical protein